MYGIGDSTLRALGGEEVVRELVDHFYDAMERLPEARQIRELHPDDLTLSRDKLATFLIGWMGGPSPYRERFGPIAIPRAHQLIHWSGRAGRLADVHENRIG